LIYKFRTNYQIIWFFAEFEASFIRMIDKVTNGSKIVISETGKELYI